MPRTTCFNLLSMLNKSKWSRYKRYVTTHLTANEQRTQKQREDRITTVRYNKHILMTINSERSILWMIHVHICHHEESSRSWIQQLLVWSNLAYTNIREKPHTCCDGYVFSLKILVDLWSQKQVLTVSDDHSSLIQSQMPKLWQHPAQQQRYTKCNLTSN